MPPGEPRGPTAWKRLQCSPIEPTIRGVVASGSMTLTRAPQACRLVGQRRGSVCNAPPTSPHSELEACLPPFHDAEKSSASVCLGPSNRRRRGSFCKAPPTSAHSELEACRPVVLMEAGGSAPREPLPHPSVMPLTLRLVARGQIAERAVAEPKCNAAGAAVTTRRTAEVLGAPIPDHGVDGAARAGPDLVIPTLRDVQAVAGF
mmetsp:Transcript_51451/g.165280  ORF Transcript_51451/g.165280 Transcript_51451/m.165280 type:complete len:204 (+) Transcript_51451:282-893(+)